MWDKPSLGAKRSNLLVSEDSVWRTYPGDCFVTPLLGMKWGAKVAGCRIKSCMTSDVFFLSKSKPEVHLKLNRDKSLAIIGISRSQALRHEPSEK
jgi:hypothetical protein